MSDPAHILIGASGPHVAKIQQALKELDSAAIEDAELQSSRYGPSTANAVLFYKKKRNIINRSYQTQADNIVGKMTIEALDREMVQKEKELPGPNTCRLDLACPCDAPNPVLRLGFAVTAGAVGVAPLTDAQIMQQAFRQSRRTLRLTVMALNGLIRALVLRAQGKGDLSAENQRAFVAATRWLSLRTREDQIAAVAHINSAVTLMNRNLSVKTSAGADPTLTRVTATFHASTDANPDHGLSCGTPFFTVDGPNCRRDVVTHEFFHFLGVKHGGGALNGPTIRSNITTPALALDSADNLAQLVSEITTPGGRTDGCARAGE